MFNIFACKSILWPLIIMTIIVDMGCATNIYNICGRDALKSQHFNYYQFLMKIIAPGIKIDKENVHDHINDTAIMIEDKKNNIHLEYNTKNNDLTYEELEKNEGYGFERIPIQRAENYVEIERMTMYSDKLVRALPGIMGFARVGDFYCLEIWRNENTIVRTESILKITYKKYQCGIEMQDREINIEISLNNKRVRRLFICNPNIKDIKCNNAKIDKNRMRESISNHLKKYYNVDVNYFEILSDRMIAESSMKNYWGMKGYDEIRTMHSCEIYADGMISENSKLMRAGLILTAVFDAESEELPTKILVTKEDITPICTDSINREPGMVVP